MTLARKLYETACEQVFAPMLPWDRVDPVHQASWEAIAEVATRELAGSDEATSGALTEQLASVLEALVKQRKGIEYASGEEQATWRRAKALLVELGR